MKTNLMKKLSCIGLLLLLCSVKQYAQTVYTVIYTGDVLNAQSSPAPGTLRWAVNQVNANAGESIINFDIPGPGPYTIILNLTLPQITKTVTIDGTTQTGYNFNDPGNPMIILQANGSLFTGFFFNSCDRVRVFGLHLRGFNYAFTLAFCNYCEVTNNVFTRSVIRNLYLYNSNFNTVKGNYINVDKTLVPTGVYCEEGILIHIANDNIIGGPNSGEGNTVAYIASEGIDLYSNAEQRNRFSGNRIFANNYEIHLQVGANGGKLPPVITTAGCDVSGTSQANNTIELFGSSGPAASRLNAKVFIGSTKANAAGQWSMPVSNITYPYVTATATDSVNNTSELAIVKAIAPDALDLTIKKPDQVCAKEKVMFEITGGKCLKALTFTWNFGDGSALSSSAEHEFIAGGTYTVTVSAYEKNNSQPVTQSLAVTVLECIAFDCASACNYTLTGIGLGTKDPGFGPGNESFVSTTGATVEVIGGVPPFTYTWTASCLTGALNWVYVYPFNPMPANKSSISFARQGVPPFSATVKVTDATGCTTYKTFTE
jgi:hypothetical protein